MAAPGFFETPSSTSRSFRRAWVSKTRQLFEFTPKGGHEMVKAGAFALLGLTVLCPVAQASGAAPVFTRATMCDAAAPMSAGATVLSRQIKATRRPEAPARRRAPAARSVPQVEEPVVEPEAGLRPAMHFCMGPPISRATVRYT
jgi:hypothetical protein